MHQLAIIAILEPFADSGNVMNFKNQLAMDNAIANFKCTICLYWNGDIDCIVRDKDEHKDTCVFNHNELQKQFTMIFFYSKCKEHLRRPRCDKMLQKADIEDKPCFYVGDYNVITSTEENLGGITYNIRERLDFIDTIQASGLMDIGFCGHK